MGISHREKGSLTSLQTCGSPGVRAARRSSVTYATATSLGQAGTLLLDGGSPPQGDVYHTTLLVKEKGFGTYQRQVSLLGCPAPAGTIQ